MSSVADQIDPETREVFEALEDLFGLFNSIGPDVDPIREIFAAQVALANKELPPFDGTIVEVSVPGILGNPEVPVRICRQNGAAHPEAVLIWLHGGGYVVGTADDMAVYRYTPIMTVVSVDYRMAPEHRSPAAAEDACAAIEWVAANAESLSLDPGRIVIGGASAGGGLTAGTALMNRDRKGPNLLYQMMLYPMIDDTHDTVSGHLDLPKYTWTRDMSMKAWSVYAEKGGATPYAAAARAKDLSGLPPAYLMTGGLDLFRDETVAYASRLMAEGIAVDLAVFPGALHAFDVLAPDSSVSKRTTAHHLNALHHILAR